MKTPQLKSKERYIVVDKYPAARNVLLHSLPQNPSFTSRLVQYDHDFAIHVGAELEIIQDCSWISNDSAQVVDNSQDKYIVGSGLLLRKNGKYFFMQNKASIGKVMFIFTILELDVFKRELDDEVKELLQKCVKQFEGEELEHLKDAINGGDSFSQFLFKGRKKENVKHFFEKYRNILLELDLSQHPTDIQLCSFKNFSPPKGKLESVANLRKKQSYYKRNGHNRFSIFERFPKGIRDNKEFWLWNALFECVEETNSVPDTIFRALREKTFNPQSFKTIYCPVVSLESRDPTLSQELKECAERLQTAFFVIEESDYSKFRLNTKFVDEEKKNKREYNTEEYWFSPDNENIPLCLREQLKE